MKNSKPSAAPAGATSEQPSKASPSRELEVVAAGKLSDTELGSQLTAQYKRAVSGMREVLIFGAMLKQVEAKLAPSVHVRTLGGKLAGTDREGGGLKGWLATHAPEISRSTAYRFLGVTEAIAAEYMQIVGPKVAKVYDLPTLVLADASTLDKHSALKQAELFDFASGTSQRSWLDRYKPAPDVGGGPGRTKITLPEKDELERMKAQTAFKAIHRLLWEVEHTRSKGTVAYLPQLSADLEAEMDLVHIEQAALNFLKLVQVEIITRGAQPTKYRL